MGYIPTDAALEAHKCQNRFVQVAGGARGSKSQSAAYEAIPQSIEPNQLGWLIGPDYEQTKAEFNYIADALKRLDLIAQSWEPRHGGQALTTKFNTTIETKTADDVRKIASKATDFILLCEAAQCQYDVYFKCLERLSEKRGWLWMCGTFEGSIGWYADMWTRWQADNPEGGRSFSLPSWSNRFVYPLGENDPEILFLKRTIPEDVFSERYGGVPVKPQNLVLKEFAHTSHVYDWAQLDEDKPVTLWIDPGYSGSHYAVLATQEHARAETRKHLATLPDVPLTDVWVIGEVYASLAVHSEVILAAKQARWWQKVNEAIGDVVMQTHPMAGESPADVWQKEAGIRPRGKLLAIRENITRHRTFLKDPASGAPRLFFNPSCVGSLAEYGSWKRKRVGDVLGDPEDKNCDALKAIGYGLVDRFGLSDTLTGKKNAPPKPIEDWTTSKAFSIR